MGKADIWMPVYIGDYLADTMHLSTEQHGAYLLLLFHLWRRGILHDDDAVLAQITGLTKSAWNCARPVLAELFDVRGGLWHHGHLEHDRARITARQRSNSQKAKLAACGRWSKLRLPPAMDAAGDASGIACAMPEDAKPVLFPGHHGQEREDS